MPSGAATPGRSPGAAAGTGSAAPGATTSLIPGWAAAELPTRDPASPQRSRRRRQDDDAPLRDDSEITAARLERRFKRLTAARRQAERERDAWPSSIR